MNLQKKHMIFLLFNEFIRLKHAITWTIISFGGFILGLSSFDLSSFIIPLVVFLISTFFIMSFTFAINNYYDIKSDKKNPRRKDINAIALEHISKQTGSVLLFIFAIIPLVVSFFFKIEAFLFCAYLIFLGWGYSAPPLRTKNRPVLDIIWHFLGFFSYIIWGSLISGSIGLINWLAAISVGVFSCIGQVDNHISDYSFDKDSGTKTFAVWIGLEKAKSTLIILTIFHLIFLIPLILLYSINYIITILIIIVIPVIGFIRLKPKRGAYPSKRCYTYYFTYIVGASVYASCLLYYILYILNFKPLNFFNIII